MARKLGAIRTCAVAVCGLALIAGGVSTADGAAGGLSREKPKQLLKQMAKAVVHAKSYELLVHGIEHGRNETMEFVMDAHGRESIRARFGRQRISMILARHHAYLKASATYWMMQEHMANEVAWVASERWFAVPVKAFSSTTPGAWVVSRMGLAACLSEDHGPLSRHGTTTVDGQKAIVLKDAGGKPGTTPGTLAIAQRGPAFPLLLTETGPTRAGGKIDACNNGKSDSSTGTLTMSHWNSAPALHVPTDPVALPGT